MVIWVGTKKKVLCTLYNVAILFWDLHPQSMALSKHITHYDLLPVPGFLYLWPDQPPSERAAKIIQ